MCKENLTLVKSTKTNGFKVIHIFTYVSTYQGGTSFINILINIMWITL